MRPADRRPSSPRARGTAGARCSERAVGDATPAASTWETAARPRSGSRSYTVDAHAAFHRALRPTRRMTTVHRFSPAGSANAGSRTNATRTSAAGAPVAGPAASPNWPTWSWRAAHFGTYRTGDPERRRLRNVAPPCRPRRRSRRGIQRGRDARPPPLLMGRRGGPLARRRVRPARRDLPRPRSTAASRVPARRSERVSFRGLEGPRGGSSGGSGSRAADPTLGGCTSRARERLISVPRHRGARVRYRIVTRLHR